MKKKEKMQRVSKTKTCPICGKPDWCLAAKDGSAAICQRIEEGSVKRCGNAGWLHIINKDRSYSHKHKKSQLTIQILGDHNSQENLMKLLSNRYRNQIGNSLQNLSASLGVSAQSLSRLIVGYDGKAFTFPMFDHYRKIIGIRRRFLSGSKCCVKGSKNGLFVPIGLREKETLLICEGPTDTAAALDLGFDAIGRPDCNSKIDMTARFVKGRNVVIIGDNDKSIGNGKCPGEVGALKLAERLVFICPSVRLLFPSAEYKDLRDWYRAGLSHNVLLKIIENTQPLTMELIK